MKNGHHCFGDMAVSICMHDAGLTLTHEPGLHNVLYDDSRADTHGPDKKLLSFHNAYCRAMGTLNQFEKSGVPVTYGNLKQYLVKSKK